MREPRGRDSLNYPDVLGTSEQKKEAKYKNNHGPVKSEASMQAC